MKYGFAFGKLAVLGTRVLDEAAIERLIDAPTEDDRLKLLSDYSYGSYLTEGASTAEIELNLDKCLEDSYDWLTDAQLPGELEDFFRVRYDFENLKAYVKARIFDVSIPPLSMHSTETMEDIKLHAQRYLAEFEENGNLGQVEVDMDKEYFSTRFSLAAKSRVAYLTELVCIEATSANVKVALRCAHAVAAGDTDAQEALTIIEGAYIGGGPLKIAALKAAFGDSDTTFAERVDRLSALTGSRKLDAKRLMDPSTLDVELSSLEREMIMRGRHMGAGPEVIISFIARSEAEINVLRILFVGLGAGFSKSDVRAFMPGMTSIAGRRS